MPLSSVECIVFRRKFRDKGIYRAIEIGNEIVHDSDVTVKSPAEGDWRDVGNEDLPLWAHDCAYAMLKFFELKGVDGCVIYDKILRQELDENDLAEHIETLNAETLAGFTLAIIRRERFCSGSLLSSVESGFVTRVLGRTAELYPDLKERLGY